MLYRDIEGAYKLRQELEGLRGMTVANDLVVSLVVIDGAEGRDIAKQWFETEGKVRIPELVRQYIEIRKGEIIAQLTALDPQISEGLNA